MKYAVVLLLLLAGCSGPGSYTYVPLAGYAAKKGYLAYGTDVQLLAFSGKGREAGKDEAFYYQFIVSSNGKTYRVLAPAIQFRAGGNYIYTDPGSLEKDKTLLTATYMPIDSATRLALQTTQLEEMEHPDNEALEQMKGKINLKELVIVPAARPDLFQDLQTPTVQGVLRFEAQPW